jgi:uncharacterized membrane protein YcaP (DUF421 family)
MDIALRGIVLYIFIVFVMRAIGRRELSSLSAIDLVLLIVLGDAIQQGLTQDDYSVTARSSPFPPSHSCSSPAPTPASAPPACGP